jgi:hypothetical protein
MCFYKYQAAHLVDEHGLEELFPEFSRDELIEEVQETAGASLDFGPRDFADIVKREAVTGYLIAILMDFRRRERSYGKRWYEYQISTEDQTLTPLEERALSAGNWMTEKDFAAEVRAFDDRREMQRRCR